MLADFIGQMILSMVGEAIGGWLFPRAFQPRPSLPEGEWNASLGSLAAFLAGIAALFCGLSVVGVLRGLREPLLWLFLGGSVMMAMLSAFLAHRALDVTRRRRALARIGLWLSRATVLVGLLAALLSFAGVTVP